MREFHAWCVKTAHTSLRNLHSFSFSLDGERWIALPYFRTSATVMLDVAAHKN